MTSVFLKTRPSWCDPERLRAMAFEVPPRNTIACWRFIIMLLAEDENVGMNDNNIMIMLTGKVGHK